MIKKYTCFIFVFLLTFILFAQKNIDPTPQYKTEANGLKEQFPGNHVALEESLDYVTFKINKKEQKVIARHETTQEMINMDSRADIQIQCFYDGQSSIEKFEIVYKNKRDARFYIKDEAYESNDLFHNDARVKYTNVDFPLKGYRYQTSIVKQYKDIK